MLLKNIVGWGQKVPLNLQKGNSMHGVALPLEIPDYLPGAIYQEPACDGNLRIFVFGAYYPNRHGEFTRQNWSLRFTTEPKHGTTAKCSLVRYLPDIARKLNVREILAPSPLDFNGRMCKEEDLHISIPFRGGAILRRGARADGCLIRKGQAFAISMAGCAIIVARHPGAPKLGIEPRVAVAHAGLKSVIDYDHLVNGAMPRVPGGIVGSLLRSIRPEGTTLADIHLRILLPIYHGDYTHPYRHRRLGEKNKKLHESLYKAYGPTAVPGWGTPAQREGMVNLSEVIRIDAIQRGVLPECISTSLSTDSFQGIKRETGEKYETLYTTRGKFRTFRNLALIVNP